MTMKKVYTAHATAIGGRGGGTAKTSDGKLNITLDHPPEMGGKGEHNNPEHLFAAGYSSCYLGAIKAVAGRQSPPVRIAPEASITAHVSFADREDKVGYAIIVELDVNLPGIDRARAEELAAKAHDVCPYSWLIRNKNDVKTTVV
jgi:lipoyl-dependent peroxiredoxin